MSTENSAFHNEQSPELRERLTTRNDSAMTIGEIVDDYRKRHPEAAHWLMGHVYREAMIERHPEMAWFRDYVATLGT